MEFKDPRLEIIAAYQNPTPEFVAGFKARVKKDLGKDYTDEEIVSICQSNANAMRLAVEGVPGYGGNPINE